ncbi:hypothetical protein IF2G_06018 [Cordyceps javanica]|nr:hypothetical protein IF2G_06018 [Cordyceps javanica]
MPPAGRCMSDAWGRPNRTGGIQHGQNPEHLSEIRGRIVQSKFLRPAMLHRVAPRPGRPVPIRRAAHYRLLCGHGAVPRPIIRRSTLQAIAAWADVCGDDPGACRSRRYGHPATRFSCEAYPLAGPAVDIDQQQW